MLMHAVLNIDDEIARNLSTPHCATLIYTVNCSEDSPVSAVEKEQEVSLIPYDDINLKDIAISAQPLKDNDVIMFRYPLDISSEDVVLLKDILQVEFPNNKVVGLVNDVELLVQNADEAIDLLEKMIAHIKISSNRPKIVLD